MRLVLWSSRNGNIQSRTDLGSYTYHATKKHAVTTAGSNSYSYDANGNMIMRNGASLAWTSYNLPATLNAGGYSAQFAYGPDRARWRQISSYANGTETTIYVGGLLEKLTTAARTHWKHMIATPSGQVQVIRRSDGTSEVLYVATDHLGSTDAVVNAAASVASRESFSVFGARRSSTWQGAPSAGEWQAIIDTSRRGFTGHEHLDNVALIHMNGRVYDPALGRFTSADPLIDGPFSSQGWNRYAYVHNRPLSATDPSGYATDTDLQPEVAATVLGQRLSGVSWTGQFINWLGVDMLDVVVLDAQGFLNSLGSVAAPPEFEVLVEASRLREGKGAGGGGGGSTPQSQSLLDKAKDLLCGVPAISYGFQIQLDVGLGGLGWQVSLAASYTTHGQFLLQAQGGGMFGLHAGAAMSLSPQVGAIGVDPQGGWSDQSVVIAQVIAVNGPVGTGYALQTGGGNGQVGVDHGRVRLGPSLSAGALISASGGRQEGKQYASAGMCSQGGGR